MNSFGVPWILPKPLNLFQKKKGNWMPWWKLLGVISQVGSVNGWPLLAPWCKKFLILDDSTSALDYLTEAKLLTAIHEELKDTTLILISQRTNSLKAADKVLLLDQGKQLGFASHDDLLAHNKFYQAIHYSQHSEEEGGLGWKHAIKHRPPNA